MILLKDFPKYGVTRDGRVWSLDWNHTGKVRELKGRLNRGGYLLVALYKDGKPYQRLIHRLVAQTFIPNPENKREVNHKNGDKANNSVENLEWATPSENMQHAHDNGLKPTSEKVKKVWREMGALLTFEQAEEIRSLYGSGKYTQKEIAAKYEIWPSQVSRIVNNKIYTERGGLS